MEGVSVSPPTIDDLRDFGLPGPRFGSTVLSTVFEGVCVSAPTIEERCDLGLPGPRFCSD